MDKRKPIDPNSVPRGPESVTGTVREPWIPPPFVIPPPRCPQCGHVQANPLVVQCENCRHFI